MCTKGKGERKMSICLSDPCPKRLFSKLASGAEAKEISPEEENLHAGDFILTNQAQPFPSQPLQPDRELENRGST